MMTAIIVFVAMALIVAIVALGLIAKSANECEGIDVSKPETNQDNQVDGSSDSTQEPSSSDADDTTEPMNGDPGVLTPKDEEKPSPHAEYEPKFKVGDVITNGVSVETIKDIKPNGYLLEGAPPLYIPFTEEDNWELSIGDGSSTQEPSNEPDRFRCIFDGMVVYFKDVVDLEKTTTIYGVLLGTWSECYSQATLECDDDYNERFYIPDNFPQITPTEGSNVNSLVLEQMCAMMFYQVLAEVMPEKRQQLAEMTMNYTCDNRTQPLYGWMFYSDPSYARMMAAIIATTTHRQDAVDAMRKELGTTMIEYKGDISELWLDLTKFMPPAPGPYLDAYKNRPNGTPAGDVLPNGDLHEDVSVEFEVSENYSLGANRKELRQRTIQAVANKECKVQHLFGKNRTVTDPNYGEMTFTPVFGKDTIGIEIPDNGAIANLVYTVGVACSNSRKPLLTAEYGRRRPGQGYYDPSAIMPPDYKALVNYAIEDGDGHRTGFYNQGGDYVDDQGNHIGDYETYYQSQLYANSYPSGHSAYIAGVTLALMEVMPDKISPLMMAMGWFRLSRCITRYHHLSDTTIGLLCGMLFLPIVRACKNIGMDGLLDLAKEEYQRLISGDPAPSPDPTEKVNTSLSYVCGGYGSCHVDAGEPQMGHCCNKEAKKDRYPSIMVSQTVKFTIEGDAGVTTIDGKTEGIFEAGAQYVLFCPAVFNGEAKTSKITLRNENGVRVLYYTLSLRCTHDDGPAER
jgi:hypothetical protein